jgi:hypothetical protein
MRRPPLPLSKVIAPWGRFDLLGGGGRRERRRQAAMRNTRFDRPTDRAWAAAVDFEEPNDLEAGDVDAAVATHAVGPAVRALMPTALQADTEIDPASEAAAAAVAQFEEKRSRSAASIDAALANNLTDREREWLDDLLSAASGPPCGGLSVGGRP